MEKNIGNKYWLMANDWWYLWPNYIADIFLWTSEKCRSMCVCVCVCSIKKIIIKVSNYKFSDILSFQCCSILLLFVALTSNLFYGFTPNDDNGDDDGGGGDSDGDGARNLSYFLSIYF